MNYEERVPLACPAHREVRRNISSLGWAGRGGGCRCEVLLSLSLEVTLVECAREFRPNREGVRGPLLIRPQDSMVWRVWGGARMRCEEFLIDDDVYRVIVGLFRLSVVP